MKKIKVAVLDDYQNVTHKFANWKALDTKIELHIIDKYIGVDKNLDAEALRVVSALPKYKPGKQRGKPVRVMFTIPINFTLN